MMTHMLFIVPYPELQERVLKIYGEYPASTAIQADIIVEMAEQLDHLDFDCDIVVARGYMIQALQKKFTGIPIVELPITSYDILRSVQECITRYHSQRIAIIGNYQSQLDAAMLSELFHNDIRLYCSPTTTEIDAQVLKSIEDGCESIIGGHSVRRCADHHGVPSVVIKVGDEAIITALNDVARTMDVITREKERARMYEIITQCSQEGILYVNNKRIIEIINKQALQMHQGNKKFRNDCFLSEFYPFMLAKTEEVLTTGREIFDELQHYSNTILSISYIPVIVSKQVAGVVISFQDITKIQSLESQVRRKLSQRGLNAKYTFRDIIYTSAKLDRTVQIAQRYAGVSSNVLIIGETGTGKELFAQSIHNASKRKEGPFVAINCASLNESLLESELFGYVEGSFTGASKGGKIGLLELAHQGTLFLDEISEFPLGLQGKLLRVLQEREVRRVGGTAVISVNVRIIAATNRDLTEMVNAGTFRRDLLFRLDVLKLKIPPLRQRPEDIAVLFQCFIVQNNQQFGFQIMGIEQDALEVLSRYKFSGNVRELKNIAERISVLKNSGMIRRADVVEAVFDNEHEDEENNMEMTIPPKYLSSEKEQILSALRCTGGNQTRAAKILGINRSTLWRKMKSYRLSPKSWLESLN